MCFCYYFHNWLKCIWRLIDLTNDERLDRRQVLSDPLGPCFSAKKGDVQKVKSFLLLLLILSSSFPTVGAVLPHEWCQGIYVHNQWTTIQCSLLQEHKKMTFRTLQWNTYLLHNYSIVWPTYDQLKYLDMPCLCELALNLVLTWPSSMFGLNYNQDELINPLNLEALTFGNS